MRRRNLANAVWIWLIVLGLALASFADDDESTIDTSVILDLKARATAAEIADVREYRKVLETPASKKWESVRGLRLSLHQFFSSTQTAEPSAPSVGYRTVHLPALPESREQYRDPLLNQLTAELMAFYLAEWKGSRLSEGRLCDLMKRAYLFTAYSASPLAEPLALENGAAKMFFFALWDTIASGEVHPCRDISYFTLHAERFQLPKVAASGSLLEFGPHRLVRRKEVRGINYEWMKGYAPLCFLGTGKPLPETVPDFRSVLSLWAERSRRTGLAL